MDRKILFVDDEPEWRETVGTWLTDAGYEVLIAADATEAMEKAQDAPLGLIILDLNLAGEDGLGLVKFLRRNHPDVAIILYTGMKHDDDQVRKMLQSGAHQYLQKGTRDELIKALRRSYRPS